MILALQIALAVGVFLTMEGVAWVMHRYVMHGFMWSLHRSHHEPRHGVFELNDLFAIVFAAPAMACFQLGHTASHWWFAIGAGITAYGVVYALFHDGLVHRRFPMPRVPVRGLLADPVPGPSPAPRGEHTHRLRLLRLPVGAARPRAKGQARGRCARSLPPSWTPPSAPWVLAGAVQHSIGE